MHELNGSLKHLKSKSLYTKIERRYLRPDSKGTEEFLKERHIEYRDPFVYYPHTCGEIKHVSENLFANC